MLEFPIRNVKKNSRVAVLGGGLTGSSIALELARSGVDVVLIEQDEQLLNRASLRNEGKIHLGFVYANDKSLETAKLQLRGSLSFRSLLARWIGPRADQIPCSTPFTYLVSASSLCTLEELESHYMEVQNLYRAHITDNPTLDYLGRRPENLYRKSNRVSPRFNDSRVIGSFQTAELAIDTQVMAKYLRAALHESESIQILTGLHVEGVVRRSDKLCVEASSDTGIWRHDFEQVVNALWDGRIEIDHTYGLPTQPGWVYRLKYRVIVRLPRELIDAPSVTMVLGPYGDVVIRPDQTAYLSWYPVGLKGWSHHRKPPDDWQHDCSGASKGASAAYIAKETLNAIDDWYPGIGNSKTLRVDAGVICAYGETDVDDYSSALHTRTQSGITSDNGYHSVDPGKLTTAPFFGHLAARAVMQH